MLTALLASCATRQRPSVSAVLRLPVLALLLVVSGCGSAPPQAQTTPVAPQSERAEVPPAESTASPEDEVAPPPPPDDPVAPDSLASLLLRVALEEAERSMELYNEVPAVASEKRADAQNRARQRVLEAALAAERAETVMRIRFAILGGIPNDAEGEMRLYLSFLSVAADDLLEVDAIDPVALAENLPNLTDSLVQAMATVRSTTGTDE